MTRTHPLTKSTQAELRARLAKHLPAVAPLIEKLGQIVFACSAGTFEAYARTRYPPDGSIAAKAEARFDTFMAEGQRFWQAYNDHLVQPGDDAELARDFLLERLDPIAQAAGVRLEDTVRLFEEMVQALAETPFSRNNYERDTNRFALAVAQDVGAALLEAGLKDLTVKRYLYFEIVRIVFGAARLPMPRTREFLRLLHTAIPHAEGLARQGKARQGKARQG